eukprot:4827045-Amphidinium_carterae.1
MYVLPCQKENLCPLHCPRTIMNLLLGGNLTLRALEVGFIKHEKKLFAWYTACTCAFVFASVEVDESLASAVSDP